MTALPGLTPAITMSATEKAQRFLGSAYDAVNGVLTSLDTVCEARGRTRGRLTSNEEDLLRAAIVFAGAGLDATVKQLLRHALPVLLDSGNPQATEKFETFAVGRVGADAEPRHLARYLTAVNPRSALIEDYVYALTGSSLQSAEEMSNAAGALGVAERGLRRDINGLREPFFKARNKVAHELDLSHPERPGDRSRAGRGTGETVTMCHEALDVTQRLINEVSVCLRAARAAAASPTPATKPATAKKATAKKATAKKAGG
ncbi:MAG TPA: hypothetical protein VK988_18790 [Acidimicrobiales bacterium]|nr:hypothetical protein [Acidimicrobiales bacterium]